MTTFSKFSQSLKSSKLTFESFSRNKSDLKRTKVNLVLLTLADFLNLYHDEIVETYDLEEYWMELESEEEQIFCLVDLSSNKVSTMNNDMKGKYKRAGKRRRDKIKNKYHYHNPFNRIHAYSIIGFEPGTTKNTISVSVVCSSNYSDQKGLGSFFMQNIIDVARETELEAIVLEVGNELVNDEDVYEEESEEEESEEEEEEEEEEDSGSEEEESEEEGTDEEEEVDYEDLIDIVSLNLWKKSIRHREGQPRYSVCEDYIRTCVSEYLYDDEYDEDRELPTIVLDDEERSYGGYYYRIGKKDNIALFNYYEKFGFKEDPKVNTELKCFSEIPFPSMILKL